MDLHWQSFGLDAAPSKSSSLPDTPLLEYSTLEKKGSIDKSQSNTSLLVVSTELQKHVQNVEKIQMAYYLLIFLFLKTDARYYNKFNVPGQAQMYLHEAKYSSLYLTIQQFSLLNELV